LRPFAKREVLPGPIKAAELHDFISLRDSQSFASAL